MTTEKLEIFDTTLRDGTQGEGVSLSVEDKLQITRHLDDFGFDYIEGGWPGSNPKDEQFFKAVNHNELKNSKICAFGSTARYPDKVESDLNLNALLRAETPAVSIFGKTWELHSRQGLNLDENENADIIYKSVLLMKEHGRIVIFDAEHFFDGFKANQKFAIDMITAAAKAGADRIVLCDTNGGSIPTEIRAIIKQIKPLFPDNLGIHAHNDGELGVANTLEAVEAGVTHIQGTINGVGERCGNANLCSVIPNVLLKLNKETIHPIDLGRLTSVSRFVYETLNLRPNHRAAYVGKSAFAHKGGIHVSAVMKNSEMYEHIDPVSVGAKQRVLISDLSGQSNIRYKAQEIGVSLDQDKKLAQRVVKKIKSLEHEGYQFEGAEASFELILRNQMGEFKPFFNVLDSRISINYNEDGHRLSDATLKVSVKGEIEHTAADGVGPVNALNNALRKALRRFYPEIDQIKLVDYKVRVLNEKQATEAKVRVLIESSDGKDTWTTVGVSKNIIEASWQAITDSINYKLYQLSINKLRGK